MSLDPTLGYQDFALRYDHAATGHHRAHAAWQAYKEKCERLARDDPEAYRRAEIAGLEGRIAEGMRALRVYVRLYRRTGDRVLYKDNGIDFEKSLLRLWNERLAAARRGLAPQGEGHASVP